MDLRVMAWRRDDSLARFAKARRLDPTDRRDDYVEAVRETQRGRKRRILRRLIDREAVGGN